METDIVKYPTDELEEGELSDGSDGSYTPLQRPDIKPLHTDTPLVCAGSTPKMAPARATAAAVANDSSESELSFSDDDDSSSGSDDGVKRLTRGDKPKNKKAKRKRPMAQLKVRPLAGMQTASAARKKYNVWSESLQEDSLMENMRGFDVTKDGTKCDRSVETYDFSMKYRLNGENRLKRSAGSSSGGDDDFYRHNSKRGRFNQGSVKDRLGTRQCSLEPRHILDLTVDEQDVEEVVARDIANKLCEEKDDLMLRVVEVLGKQKAIEFFRETQRIESEGGMMIINGQRRRTPGGVFLFLIKGDTKISDDDKRAVFQEDVRKANNGRKLLQASRRDQKVEELKKRLNIQDKELKPMVSRSESLTTRTHLKPDTNGTLSNPPPSPVTNSGQDNSPDYSAHAINHVNHDSSPEKVASPDDSLTYYDDDVLDMNCDDMDLF